MKFWSVREKLLGIPCRGIIGNLFNTISFKKYMQYIIWYYRKLGVNISVPVTYIHPSVYFDSHKYSLISIGNNVTISRNVTLLVHDYSIANVLAHAGYTGYDGVPHFEKEIQIGKDSFIGANAILLPGTRIGSNCIVGAGAVVKGKFPDDSIIVGNPAKVISNTDEWAKRKWKQKDWGTQ